MQEWRYKTVVVSLSTFDEKRLAAEMEKALNAMGLSGWEFVNSQPVMPVGSHVSYGSILIFRKSLIGLQ